MTPRRYRGSAPVRFRVWVLPVVGGLLGGALIQYGGAIALMPDDFLCNVAAFEDDDRSAWFSFPLPDASPGPHTPLLTLRGDRPRGVHSGPLFPDADTSPNYRMSRSVPSLIERAVRWASPEVAAEVNWPRIALPYRRRAQAEVHGERFGVWSHRWGL